MIFNFPRVRFVDSNAIIKQISHIDSEVHEAVDAAMTPNINDLAGELMDVLHSAESALRIMEEFHGVNLAQVRCETERKNTLRGYYDDVPSGGLNKPQPPPITSDHPAVWDLVMIDMIDRDQSGLKKYGTRLQPHNGRDFLVDAYQEMLDCAVYLRGAIFERDGK